MVFVIDLGTCLVKDVVLNQGPFFADVLTWLLSYINRDMVCITNGSKTAIITKIATITYTLYFAKVYLLLSAIVLFRSFLYYLEPI